MFSTNHNSARRAVPATHSRSETPLISPTPTLANGATQNSNREWPVRLEFAVTSTKQKPEPSSNRHNRAILPADSRPIPPATFVAAHQSILISTPSIQIVEFAVTHSKQTAATISTPDK